MNQILLKLVIFLLRKLYDFSPPFIANDTSNIQIQTISNILHKVDVKIFKPISASDKLLPILVYYHGGGWMLGSSKAYGRICKSIAKKANCIVACVDYRLAPEYKFPAAHNDAIGSYEWIHKNALSLGGNNDRMYIAGDSAGGNLALNVTKHRALNGLELPLAQALVYPVLKADDDDLALIARDDNLLIRSIGSTILNFFLKNYFNKNEYFINEMAATQNADSYNSFPKTLIVTAALDPLTPLISKAVDHYKNDNRIVKHLHYPYTVHGFMNFTRFSKSARDVVDEICKLIK